MKLSADLYNRQLHPEEKKWISENEAAFAKQYGITPEQAHDELTMQANLLVQNGSPGQRSERADRFLKNAHDCCRPMAIAGRVYVPRDGGAEGESGDVCGVLRGWGGFESTRRRGRCPVGWLYPGVSGCLYEVDVRRSGGRGNSWLLRGRSLR